MTPLVPPVVLVTGVSRFLGARVAARLAADPRVGRVIGVAAAPLSRAAASRLSDIQVVEADLVTDAELVTTLAPQVVVHLGVISAPESATGGRAGMKDQNIIGTMRLLAACQRIPGLRKLVIRSSTAAYGASFRDPAVFSEQTEPQEVPRGGFARDILDIEAYVRGFSRRRPEVITTVLRLAPLVGPAAETTLTRYFSQLVVPTVLGRDPRLQFAHVDDALEILHRSVVADHPGTYNVAGPGVLTLSQAIRRAGRLPVPVLETGLSTVAELVRRFDRGGFGLDQVDLFVHGRVVDISRLVQEYGISPRSTPEAFADFLAGRGAGGLLRSDRVVAAEQVLLAGIRRVRRSTGDGAAGDGAAGDGAAAGGRSVGGPLVGGDRG